MVEARDFLRMLFVLLRGVWRITSLDIEMDEAHFELVKGEGTGYIF
jgi:hypothetical protein